MEASLIASYNLGTVTGEIRVDYDNTGVKGAKEDIRELGDESTTTAAKTDKLGDSHEKSRKKIATFGKDVRNTKEALDAFGQAAGLLGKIDPSGMAGLATQVATLGVAVVPAAGAMAVLPAIALSTAAAFAVAKIGTAGMGDAFKAVAEGDAKKLDEAMKKLAPSAQAVVRQYQAMKPQLDGLKMNVQNALFKDQAATMDQMGKTFLPVLNTGFTNIATQMNSMATQSAKALMTPATVEALNKVLVGTESLFRELGSAPGDVLAGIINMAGVGSSRLGGMGEMIGGVAARFREWTASAEGQQQINTWIEQGFNVLSKLWQILTNIASIALSVFRPLQQDSKSVLDTLIQLTGQFAAWAASAQGQQTIANIWNLLATVGGNLVTIVMILAPILAAVANAFAALPAPVQQVIGFMATWSTIIGFVTAKLVPLIGLAIQLGPVIMKIGPALTTLGSALLRVGGILRAVSLLMMTNPWILLAVAVVALAVIIYQNWDAIWAFLQAVWAKITAAWQVVVSFFSSTGSSVWEGIKTAWTTSINAIAAFFSSIWEGAKSIWQTVVSFFTSVGTPVWNLISAAWQTAISNLVAFFSAIWTTVTAIFGAFVNSVIAIGSAVWEVIKTLWQAAILTIYAILTGQWNLIGQIWSTFIAKILSIGSNLWNTISGIWSGAIATISGAISSFVSTVVSNISSFVSRVIAFFTNLGSSIVSAVTNFASNAQARVSAFVSQVISFFSNLASQGAAKVQQMGSQIVSAIGSAISSFISRVSSGVSQVVSQFTSLASRVVSTLMSLPGRMASLGGQIISGIINGIAGAAGRLFSYLGGLAASALNAAKAAFGIGSPSKKFRDLIGKELPEGVAVGVIASAKIANQAAKDMAIGVTASAIDGLSDVQVQRVGALVGANTAATSGAVLGASTAAAAGASSSSRSMTIGQLTLDVKGIIDPTDPVSWRRFGEEVRDLLRDVEVSYK